MRKKQQKKLLSGILLAIGGIVGVKLGARFAFKRFFRKTAKLIMTDEYHENLWEFVTAASRVGLQKIVEMNLRAESGEVVKRPLGSPKKYPSVDNLLFSFAQIATMPLQEKEQVDTSVIIGRKARKPLVLDIPILIGGMGYGFSLSEQFRLALAKGATLAGTAFNTGQGGVLPGERRAAKQLILQYNRGDWSKEPHILRQADALELHFGQGAVGGSFGILPAQKMTRNMRKMFRRQKGERVVYPARIPGIERPEDLLKKVKELRSITDGIPIGAKIAAGDMLEKDLVWCLEAGLDYVAVSGAEGAVKGAPPTLLDDHGLPTLIALSRAVKYLEKLGAKKEIDLIIDGKLITPGDILKVLALGANAVYIGTAALFATAHTQVLKAMPFEPHTALSWNIGKYSRRFNSKKGAGNLHLFLKSCTLEMRMSLSSMGKASIKELSKADLVAVDPFVADITGVKLAHIPG